KNALWRLLKEPPQLGPIQPHDLLYLGGRRHHRPFGSADENKADAGLSAELLVTAEGHKGEDVITVLRMHRGLCIRSNRGDPRPGVRTRPGRPLASCARSAGAWR